MSTPKEHPVIFLFTSDTGHAHGYLDGFREDGVFCYTGEGQRGNMKMAGSNKALRDHEQQGKAVHLFEFSKAIGKGKVRYIGEAFYLGHNEESRHTNGESRTVIVFELAVDNQPEKQGIQPKEQLLPAASKKIQGLSIEALRQMANEKASQGANPQQRLANVYKRSEAIRAYVLKRADGRCEKCGEAAPFKTKHNQPYLEPHHTTRVADGGPDAPEHVIALCPNCHRRAHYAHDNILFNLELIKKLALLEPESK